MREYGIFPTYCPTRDAIASSLGVGENNGPLGQAPDAEYGTAELYAVYVTYLMLTGKAGYYTFDDQVLFGLVLLRTNPDLQWEYRRFVEHVIADELQDFTPAAAELFKIVSGTQPNVMAFDDRDQTIRVMNASADEVFEQLRALDSCGEAHRLTTNFRSTQEILDLAVDVPTERRLSRLRAARGSGERPVLLWVETSADLPDPVALGELVDVALDWRPSLNFACSSRGRAQGASFAL